jgi:hypothetical protein
MKLLCSTQLWVARPLKVKFPAQIHKLEVVPKSWEKTMEIEKIPAGEVLFNNSRGP